MRYCADRDVFAAELARAMADELRRWRDTGLAPIIARWQVAAHPLGTRITLAEGGLSGAFAGLTQDGGLRMVLDDGTCHSAHAGEITLA